MNPEHIAAFNRARTSEYLTVEENCRKLNKFIEDYEAVKSSLTSLSEKCRHPVMVPFGNVAFMSGSVVHTNDVLVLLGDNWFVEQSSKQTVEMLNRRIAALQTQADQLETRLQQIKTELSYAKDLAEESSNTVEIVEPYDEEFEESWKMQRKCSKEMKDSEPVDVSDLARADSTDYEQIWRRLEQLEEEEAEEQEGDDDVEAEEGEVDPPAESVKQQPLCDPQDDSENTREHCQPLVINFKHSVTGSQIRERTDTVCCPADIYDIFCVQCGSVTSHVGATNVDQTQQSQSRDLLSEISESRSRVESHVAVSLDSDVLPRSVVADVCSSATEPTTRKVSKFKASRLKK